MTSQRREGPVDVRFLNVSKRFGDHQAVDAVTLNVPAGSTTCIIGPSGSGKSTLLRCANMLEAPDSGQVFIGDSELTAPTADLNEARREIGMVFQQFNLFPHLNSIQNVTFALRRVHGVAASEAADIAKEHLDRVGVGHLAQRRPDQISGGERQRVAIARTLAIRPKVMLLDEVTSALDPELVKGVLALMRELSEEGMTMIVVTHEMRFARAVPDEVVFMDRGALVEQGDPEQMFDAPASTRLREFIQAMS